MLKFTLKEPPGKAMVSCGRSSTNVALSQAAFKNKVTIRR